MIVARAAQGVRQHAIAAEAGVSERTVRDVLTRVRSLRSPLDKTPMALLEDLARLYELDAGDLEAMSAAYFESNPSAAITAKRAAIDTRCALAELMCQVGKLPTDLELFRSEMQMRAIGARMRLLADQMLSGEVSVEEARRFYDQIARNPGEAIESAGMGELAPLS